MRFFESVGPHTSFQTMGMHGDIVLDIYGKKYFPKFSNSFFCPRLLIDLCQILMHGKVLRCIGKPIVVLVGGFGDSFEKITKSLGQKNELENFGKYFLP